MSGVQQFFLFFFIISRLPSSPLLGKSSPQPQSSQTTSVSLHPNHLPLPQKGKRKYHPQRRSQKLKLTVHPLKPALVTSYLLARNIALLDNEDSANEVDEDMVTDDEGEEESEEASEAEMLEPEVANTKTVKGEVEQIKQLTISDS